jgi:hypothetical protein
MRRIHLFVMSLAVASVLAPALAHAQTPAPSAATVTGATSGRGLGIGIGAVHVLNGNTDALFTWGEGGGRFHVDGLFGLHRDGETDFDIGARFWYHVHAMALADLSLGIGGVLISDGRREPLDRLYHFVLEVGAQMRAFVVPNVAVLGTVGLGVRFNDGGDDSLLINGQTVGGGVAGSIGIAYYFE